MDNREEVFIAAAAYTSKNFDEKGWDEFLR